MCVRVVRGDDDAGWGDQQDVATKAGVYRCSKVLQIFLFIIMLYGTPTPEQPHTLTHMFLHSQQQQQQQQHSKPSSAHKKLQAKLEAWKAQKRQQQQQQQKSQQQQQQQKSQQQQQQKEALLPTHSNTRALTDKQPPTHTHTHTLPQSRYVHYSLKRACVCIRVYIRVT
jgi:hypothetical protein